MTRYALPRMSAPLGQSDKGRDRSEAPGAEQGQFLRTGLSCGQASRARRSRGSLSAGRVLA